MGVVFLLVGLIGTILSFIILPHLGRRTIYNTGLLILSILQFLIGILDCFRSHSNAIVWAQSVLMVIWNGFYDLSIGPVCFVLICEASAMKLRSKTIALATAVQALMGIVMTVAIPYLINPDQVSLSTPISHLPSP